jgi:hypothetical protein
MTPEETKQAYMEQGYSVIAFTDHNLLLDQNKELSDENFLALNGFEVDDSENYTEEKNKFADIKTCHICFIAKDPGNVTHPFWHRSKYLYGAVGKHRHLAKFNEDEDRDEEDEEEEES